MIGVLFDDADEQDAADLRRFDAEFRAAQQQANCADARGWKAVERMVDGMNVAFVEDAQHDVDSSQRGQDQNGLIGKRSARKRRACLEGRLTAGGMPNSGTGGVLMALTASAQHALGAA